MAEHGASASSSSSPSYFAYDVFLSFRGDTRYRFTDHLYHALKRHRRLKIFRDDPGLTLGDVIGATLAEAIERSRMSIVVISVEYASSTWCLDELVKIMECSHNGTKRPVFPIFYHVEPSDVRYQKNKYAKALKKIEGRYGKDSEKMKAWRSALLAVCNLSGIHCTEGMYEGETMEKIVEQVLGKLPPDPLYITRQLGFESELEEVKSLLDIESRDTRCIIGIYGDGEIDKATFAAELYNKIRDQFEAGSFLANVSEKSKEGLEGLQKTLLSEMGEELGAKIGSTFKGSSEIKQRLGHKRVVLVLDDVDSIQQLNSLAGGSDWFGGGSRIIITTDHHMLDMSVLHGVEIKKYCIGKAEFDGTRGADDESNRRQKRYVEEDDVVDFVNNFKAVTSKLKTEDSRSNVVSIIGMGGLGKTTLARKIYNNNEVKKLFPCRAWSYVSKDYNRKEVLLRLLDCLMSSTSKFKDSNEEVLRDNLIKCLDRKKYLIVLDDVWETDVWDDFRDIFRNDSKGSKILITSRNNEVANYTSPMPPHLLPFLDEEKSWELFCKKVFWGGECPSDLEHIGRSIVESCAGLPIAIVALAGILAKKKRSRTEWLRIEGHVRWHLAQDKSKVWDVLKLSYDLLPKRLKPCFLYFGMFPEDYEIPVKQLIQLWLAEGFLEPQGSGIPNPPEPEDVGEEYLDELLDRNLVQVACTRSYGGVKTCRIHDFLHDLCMSESKTDNFLEVCTESNFHTLSNPRRLSFLCSAESYISSIKCNNSCTQSVANFYWQNHSGDTFQCFQSARVLHFAQAVRFRSVSSAYLETMIHLKYIRVRRSDGYQDAPKCIWSLPNLETLDFWGWYTGIISDKFWKLTRLRHLFVRWDARLPAEELPKDSSRAMWNLQTLNEVALDAPTALLFSNDYFPNLRMLGLWYDPKEEKCSLQELLPSLNHLSKLRSLKIRCTRSRLCFDALPSKLIKITFEFFNDLDSKSMNILGQLPYLQSLTLLGGTVHSVGGEFPRLLVLKFKLVKLQSRILESGAMPRLQCLVVEGYSECTELPQRLWSLNTLRQLRLVKPSEQLKNSLQNVVLNPGCNITIQRWSHNS